MRSARIVFLALAFADSFATTSTSIHGDDRHYADALEELEHEMMIGDGGGVRKASARGDAGRSRSTPTTANLHRHRIDADDEHTGYNSHQIWKEDKKEELEGMRRRASETLADHLQGRETLDERDLVSLSKRMAALERKIRSVEGETPERVNIYRLPLSVSSWTTCLNIFLFLISRDHPLFVKCHDQYLERIERQERRLLEKFDRKKLRHAERVIRRRRSDKAEL